METNVLVERVSDNRYRATGSAPFALSVEGATRDEALANFQKAAPAMLPPDSEVVRIEIRNSTKPLLPKDDPWAWFAGRLEAEPLYDLYQEQIQLNRLKDEDEEKRKEAEGFYDKLP